MPIHDHRGGPIPGGYDPNEQIPGQAPPEPTPEQIAAFKAQMADEMAAKQVTNDKEAHESRKIVARELHHRALKVDFQTSFAVRESDVLGVGGVNGPRGGKSVLALHNDHPVAPPVDMVRPSDGVVVVHEKHIQVHETGNDVGPGNPGFDGHPHEHRAVLPEGEVEGEKAIIPKKAGGPHVRAVAVPETEPGTPVKPVADEALPPVHTVTHAQTAGFQPANTKIKPFFQKPVTRAVVPPGNPIHPGQVSHAVSKPEGTFIPAVEGKTQVPEVPGFHPAQRHVEVTLGETVIPQKKAIAPPADGVVPPGEAFVPPTEAGRRIPTFQSREHTVVPASREKPVGEIAIPETHVHVHAHAKSVERPDAPVSVTTPVPVEGKPVVHAETYRPETRPGEAPVIPGEAPVIPGTELPVVHAEAVAGKPAPIPTVYGKQVTPVEPQVPPTEFHVRAVKSPVSVGQPAIPGEKPVHAKTVVPGAETREPHFQIHAKAEIPHGKPQEPAHADLPVTERAEGVPEGRKPIEHVRALEQPREKPAARRVETHSDPIEQPVVRLAAPRDSNPFHPSEKHQVGEPPAILPGAHPVSKAERPLETGLELPVPDGSRPEDQIQVRETLPFQAGHPVRFAEPVAQENPEVKPTENLVVRAEAGTGAPGAEHHEKSVVTWERDPEGFTVEKADQKRAARIDDHDDDTPPIAVPNHVHLVENDPILFNINPGYQAPLPQNHEASLAHEVVSMVDRFLVTAEPGSYVKELHMTMNDQVLAGVEIQFRQVGNSLVVTLVNHDGANAELLRREAPDLAEALRTHTGEDVEVRIVTAVGGETV